MQTVTYAAILAGTADLVALDRDNLLTADFNALRTYHSNRLQSALRRVWWNDLMRLERRWFRDEYAAATSYAVGDEVYHPDSDGYYVCVVAGSGDVPASLVADEWVVDYTRWALHGDADQSSQDWETATAYAVGDRVTWQNDTYACISAHTDTDYSKVPSNATYWSAVPDFDKYVAFEQTSQTAIDDVRSVWSNNPKTTTLRTQLGWWASHLGIQTPDADNYVWLDYRIRVSRLSGAAYAAGTTYTAGQQCYYTDGDFYDCILASLGNLPTVTTYWTKVELPAVLERYLIHAGAADWCFSRKEFEQGGLHKGLAEQYLIEDNNLLGNTDGAPWLRAITR